LWKERLSTLRPRDPRKLIVLLAIAILAITSYAATVTVSTTTYQSQYGVDYNITSAFTATDKGFASQGLTQAASAQPCTWASAGVCRTALTAGHYRYQLTLTLNTVPGATTTYTVTVLWDQGGGQVTMGTLTVSVPNTAVAAQVMTFNIDTGGASFTTPLAVDVTVA
jgi:hypothetical protein